eukprot:SAG31_NODE_218_length_19934_cov_81.634837_13_plen_91_part_00
MSIDTSFGRTKAYTVLDGVPFNVVVLFHDIAAVTTQTTSIHRKTRRMGNEHGTHWTSRKRFEMIKSENRVDQYGEVDSKTSKQTLVIVLK